MKKSLRVYVAGPITKGHRLINIRNSCIAAAALMREGHIPFVPHLYDLVDTICGETYDYEGWMMFDEQWLKLCEAVIRIPGDSIGADREVILARELGIPVYFSVAEFLEAQK